MNHSKNLPLAVALCLAMPVLSSGSTSAHAEALTSAMLCELKVKKHASEIIFDLKLVLDRKNALSRDEFPQIRGALDTLEQYGNSDLAKQCFRTYPDQKLRYNRWLQQQTGEVVAAANQRLDATCSRRTRMFINSNTLRINAAIAGNHLALAARYAKSMRVEMDSDAMIARCAPTADEINRLRTDYLPSILNQVALPEVIDKMTSAFGASRTGLDMVGDALRSSEGQLMPAPEELESVKGQEALRANLSNCIDYGRALVKLGADPHLELNFAGQTVPRELAVDFCERAAEALDSTFSAIVGHNEGYRKMVLNRWRRASLKGFGMEKLFEARGRPQAEWTLGGGAIVWEYQADNGCSQVRFTPRGKLMDEKIVACTKLQLVKSL